MKVFVQVHGDNEFRNLNCFQAFDGFEKLGYEVNKARDVFDVECSLENNEPFIVVGTVKFAKRAMQYQDIPIPDPIDYPDCLSGSIHRDIRKTGYGEDIDFPKFVKPIEHKRFTGQIVNDQEEFEEVIDDLESVWVSEVVDFESEYRIFVNKDRGDTVDEAIVGIKHYKGDATVFPKSYQVTAPVGRTLGVAGDVVSLPISYSIDIGLRSDMDSLVEVVEVNDSFSLGCYGLNSVDYAKMIEARWDQLHEKG